MTTTPTNPSITLGGSNTDGVTVTGVGGVTPTGTVTFYVCGPFTSDTACTAAGTKVGTSTLTGTGNMASATSPSFTPTATGIYCFFAVYAGDGNYGTASDGTIPRECFTVNIYTPTVATTPTNPTIILGGSNTDGVTVTGVGGVTPTGSVHLLRVPVPSAPAHRPARSGWNQVGIGRPDRHRANMATATGPIYTPTGHRRLLLLRRLLR